MKECAEISQLLDLDYVGKTNLGSQLILRKDGAEVALVATPTLVGPPRIKIEIRKVNQIGD